MFKVVPHFASQLMPPKPALPSDFSVFFGGAIFLPTLQPWNTWRALYYTLLSQTWYPATQLQILAPAAWLPSRLLFSRLSGAQVVGPLPWSKPLMASHCAQTRLGFYFSFCEALQDLASACLSSLLSPFYGPPPTPSRRSDCTVSLSVL